MRILMLNYEYPPLGGGAAPVTEEILKNLALKGHVIDIVTMGFKNLPATEIKDGITIHRVPCIRSQESKCKFHEMLSFLPIGFWKSRQLIKQNKYDFVHSHFIIPTGVISLLLNKLYKLPYIITAHGSDVPGHNPDKFNKLHTFILPIWKKIVANSFKVISPSEYLGKRITESYSKTSLEVIPNGFDYHRIRPDRIKDKRILVSSRLLKMKGIQHFIKCLGCITTDWEIVIVGDGDYKKELEAMAKSSNLNIMFTGWLKRDALQDLLETSAIYVFTSSNENCPVALQEAMAAGCAIIASKYSGTFEVIGDSGITIDPKDQNEFSTVLNKLLNDNELRVFFGKKARERIEIEYDWGIISNKYIEIFNQACDSRFT
ncbi:MAG: glycosyltransferase family 4 protein [Methanosarcinaceae archaeon]|nr:glycosyltransferase family 4 protein [Candidatus Cloacimonadota bacterium]MDD4498078.1 glycosyltransferase family 4 protein [Methanosarcinaceae archaeon]